LLHPPPIGVTISIASPASTLASAQPDRVSMLPSLRRTELRPGPTPACAQTWDNAGPASMSPRSAGKGTDGIAYWIRRYFIVSNFARWLSIASLPATSLPLFATVRLEVTVDRYQPENPEPFSGRASVVPRETKIALNACARSQQRLPAMDRRARVSALAGKLDLGCAASDLCLRGFCRRSPSLSAGMRF
jgi:hypothetical protein